MSLNQLTAAYCKPKLDIYVHNLTVCGTANLPPPSLTPGAENQILRVIGGSVQWTDLIAPSNIPNNSVDTVNLIDGSVTNSKIANGSVTTNKIVGSPNDDYVLTSVGSVATWQPSTVPDGSITTAKLADMAVTNEKIADATILGAKLVTATITPNKLQASPNDDWVLTSIGNATSWQPVTVPDGSITTAKLADLAVTNSKLATNSVSDSKIIDFAVSTTKINDLAVETIKIAPNAVTEAKIADASISNAKLQVDSVGSANIIDSSITTPLIDDEAVTPAKLEPSIVDNWVLTTVSGSVQWEPADTSIPDGSITTAKLADLAVTNAKLADASISNSKLEINSVDTINIVLDAITTPLIEDGAITTTKIGNSEVTPAKIQPGSNGEVLTTVVGVASWVVPSSYNPLIYKANCTTLQNLNVAPTTEIGFDTANPFFNSAIVTPNIGGTNFLINTTGNYKIAVLLFIETCANSYDIEMKTNGITFDAFVMKKSNENITEFNSVYFEAYAHLIVNDILTFTSTRTSSLSAAADALQQYTYFIIESYN